MFTKKHFQAIAELFAEIRMDSIGAIFSLQNSTEFEQGQQSAVYQIEKELLKMFAESNEGFDKSRFYDVSVPLKFREYQTKIREQSRV